MIYFIVFTKKVVIITAIANKIAITMLLIKHVTYIGGKTNTFHGQLKKNNGKIDHLIL